MNVSNSLSSLHHQNHKIIAGAREKTRHVLHRLLVFVGRRELAARATEVNIATMVLISIENQQTVQYMLHFLVWSWDGHAVIQGQDGLARQHHFLHKNSKR